MGDRMKNAITKHSVVEAASGQVSSDLGEELAILDLEAGVYYGLDAVGARIWHLIEKPRTVSDIRDILLEEYDVEHERCERDLLALLRSLADEGLVEVKYEAPT